MISIRQNDGTYVTTPVYVGQSPEDFKQCDHDWYDDANLGCQENMEWIKLQRCDCGAVRTHYKYLDGKDPNND